MHEWALAEGVITTALNASEKEGFKRICKIVISIGQLQQISTDIFEGALREVMPASEPRLRGVAIALETVEAVFACRVCATPFTFSDAVAKLTDDDREAIHFIPELAHTFFRCPTCNSADFDVRTGRGVWIERIEGE